MNGTFPLPMKHQTLAITMISIIMISDFLDELCATKTSYIKQR
jgi:hypothetical protein